MSFSPVLLIYRWAWEPALILIRILARIEKVAGGSLWPTRWQLGKRLSGREDSAWANTEHRMIWMHAASLGECKGLWATAQATTEALAVRDEITSVILTANTMEGYAFLAAQVQLQCLRTKRNSTAWQVRLAPLDHPREVRKFLRRYNIRALALFEVELWPHFILESRRAGNPVFWISARFGRHGSESRASTPYRFFPGALRILLSNISWGLAQTRADAIALSERGIGAIETGADLRGLYYLPPVSASFPREEISSWESRAGIALVSFHEEELGAIASLIQDFDSRNVPLFIFPRKMNSLPKFLARLAPMGFELRSQNPRAARQIVDSFGLVSEILILCRAAVIGGSFTSYGGHNLWEPLAASVRIAIGPHYENQEYLAAKLAAAGLLEISSGVEGYSLDFGILHNGPNPRIALLEFMETERILLEKSVNLLQARL